MVAIDVLEDETMLAENDGSDPAPSPVPAWVDVVGDDGDLCCALPDRFDHGYEVVMTTTTSH